MPRSRALPDALPLLVLTATFAATALLAGCSPRASHSSDAPSPQPRATSSDPAIGEGLILQESEGERRVRRPRPDALAQTSPFIIKVDRQNGGSQDLVMGYESIAPGQAIRPHHHPMSDEIIFVHHGSGVASLGSRSAQVSAGATVYIPRNTRIALKNTGTEPLTIAFIFSKPGFEELMRENSVREGEPPPLSAEETAAIKARHRAHVVDDRP